MSKVVEGVVYGETTWKPLSGISVVAFSVEGLTEGSDTTDSNGHFKITGLTDRQWTAKLPNGQKGHIVLMPFDPQFIRHERISDTTVDSHHDQKHLVSHHTFHHDPLSLTLIAGVISDVGHGDQGTNTASVHSIMSDADADTLIQLEESDDEDRIRFDAAGTERATIDSNGIKVQSGAFYITEAAAAGSDFAGQGQLWVKNDSPATLWFTDDVGTDTQLGAGGGANHDILDGSVHQDSVADGVTRGSIIYGNATPKWDELVVGTDKQVLVSDGTDVAWDTIASVATYTWFIPGAISSGDAQGPIYHQSGPSTETVKRITIHVGTAGAADFDVTLEYDAKGLLVVRG
jgi:hypothetical protein